MPTLPQQMQALTKRFAPQRPILQATRLGLVPELGASSRVQAEALARQQAQVRVLQVLRGQAIRCAGQFPMHHVPLRVTTLSSHSRAPRSHRRAFPETMPYVQEVAQRSPWWEVRREMGRLPNGFQALVVELRQAQEIR